MKSIKPIIPYKGGKRLLAPKIAKIIRSCLRSDSTYYEPFIGGGAVFLELEHPKSVIGDVVPELINLYECVRDDYKKVIWYYEKMPNKRKPYYQIRNFDRSPYYESRNRFFKAGRFVYMAKAGFGSVRFNQYGQMNQSFGGNPQRPYYPQEKDMLRMSRLLKTTEIHLDSYDKTLAGAKEGDVVYLDPPYTDKDYDRYWITKFKKSDMETMKTLCDDLNNKGVKFILSHSADESVKNLYQEDYNIICYDALRALKFQGVDSDRYDGEFLISNIKNVL